MSIDTTKKISSLIIDGVEMQGYTPPNLQEKTTSVNGFVSADEGYDGLSGVNVNVSTTYEQLPDKPKINNVELTGNISCEQLGVITQELDPTIPQHVKQISEEDIANWNNKVDPNNIPDTSQFITKETNSLLNYYNKDQIFTKQEVEDLVNNINRFSTEIVDKLPSENINPLTLYFLIFLPLIQ